MHYLVSLIVEADNADEANNRADSIMQDLIEREEFDWYSTAVDGSRWPNCWKPASLDDNKTIIILRDAINDQLTEFVRIMAVIRHMLDNYTDQQIFNENFEQVDNVGYLSRYQFSRASGYHGNVCQIYDTNGSTITNYRELNPLLSNTSRLWLVQVDCHN
jgi:hypothetical protein